MTSSVSPTPTERLDAAAAELLRFWDEYRLSGNLGVSTSRERQDRATAALLRRVAVLSASGNGIPAGRGLGLEEALRVADAVLGEQP